MRITDVLDIHPDIMAAEIESPHGNGNIIQVMSPGIGFGGDKIEGTVTIVYECECDYSGIKNLDKPFHGHHALYGPKHMQFADDCSGCLKHKWTSHEGHEYIPIGEEILDPSHMTLYAD